jgi:hypothetical protein
LDDVASYTAEKWKRLEAVRAKYDSHGVFFGFLGGTRFRLTETR